MENRARFLRNCHPIFHEQSVFRGACPRKTRDWIFFRRLRAAKLGETEASEPLQTARLIPPQGAAIVIRMDKARGLL